MKALILDGSHPDDYMTEQINAALTERLQTRGWQMENILLRDQKIGNCAGDFFCWTRNPGMCNINDDNRVIAAKMMQSDLLIYLTPVTFGGYSSTLKRAVDHLIQNVLPFFANINGEIHHQKRYKKYPSLLAIGWMDSPDAQAEAVFRNLVKRNAINMYARSSVCGLVVGSQTVSDLAAPIEGWLEDIAHGSNYPVPALPRMGNSTLSAKPVERALLLVGSPRTRKSTSASLGGYLMEQLASHGTQIETIQIHTTVNSRERVRSMLESVDGADLVVLAFPLYVDSLPAPVMAALEKIAEHRTGGNGNSHPRFAAIANCGFPEATHNTTALAICETFARQAGFTWAGSLALGGGEGLVHGTPLNELDGRAIPLKKSLEMAAEALAAGNAIPQSANDLMTRPPIPNWLYLLVGAYGWKQRAKQYGVDKLMKKRPYSLSA
jgi:multimeric flavodoxin WrbA